MSAVPDELFPYRRPRWLARLHVVGLLGLIVLILLGAWWMPGLATGHLLAVVAPWAVIELGVLVALYAWGKISGLRARAWPSYMANSSSTWSA